MITANRIDLSAGGASRRPPAGRLVAPNLHLNLSRPASLATGTLLGGARNYSGTYLLTQNNAITSLHVGGVLGGDLYFRDDAGFALASAINTGTSTTARNTLTLQKQRRNHPGQHGGNFRHGQPGRAGHGAGSRSAGPTAYTGTTTVEAVSTAPGATARGCEFKTRGALGLLSGGKVTVQKNASLILDLTSTDSFVNFRKNLELEGEGAEVSGNRLGALRFIRGGTNATLLSGGTITLTGDTTIHNNATFRRVSGAAQRTLDIIADLRLQGAVGTSAENTPYDLTITGLGYTNIGQAGSFSATTKGVISGTGELIKDGSGELQMRKRLSLNVSTATADNLYTGTFRMENGTLGFNALTVSNRSSLIVEGGNVNILNNSFTLRGVELKGGNISGSGTLTLDTGNFILESGTVGPSLAGSAGLIKQGAPTSQVTLARANTYTGATQVNAGTLRINHPNGLGGTGSTSGTTINRGGILESVLTSPSRTILINAGEALTLSGGILRLRREYTDSSARTFSNTITLSADSTIEHIFVGPTGAAGSRTCAPGAACDRTTTLSSNLSLQSTIGMTTTGHILTIRTQKTGNLVGNFISRVVLNGNISGAGGLIKEGTGDLRLTGISNTYTGPTTINGGSLTLTRTNAISTASRLIINNGATLNMGNFNQTLRGLQLNDGNITANARLAVTGPPALAEQGVLTVTPARADGDPDGKGEFDVRKGAIAAILRGTNINLVKRTDGTNAGTNPGGLVTLSHSGNHPLTGNVSVEAGQLIISGTMTGSILVVGTAASAGTYDLAGNTQTFGGVRLVRGTYYRQRPPGQQQHERVRRADRGDHQHQHG